MNRLFRLYTDGSCQPNPGLGGWGAILIYKHDNGRVYKRTACGSVKNSTNNRMEVTAVIEGLSLLTCPCDVVIYSDSRYVIDAIGNYVFGRSGTIKGWIEGWRLNNWTKKGKTLVNSDLWQELYSKLIIHDSISTVWVKGHNGHDLNEECDQLALLARKANV